MPLIVIVQRCYIYNMKTVLILFFLFKIVLVNAQNLEWVKSEHSSDEVYSMDLAIDNQGNIYTAGHFKGTVDFDPNAGVSEFTSLGNRDIFIQKLDPVGDLVWVKTIRNSTVSEIELDTANNIYLTGSFLGTVDFDPNIGISNLTSKWFK